MLHLSQDTPPSAVIFVDMSTCGALGIVKSCDIVLFPKPEAESRVRIIKTISHE